MWVHEHVGQTSATAESVWKVLRNLDEWSTWDTSMEWVRLEGPFAIGSTVVMKPIGQDEPINSVITAIVANERYADETQFEGVTLRFSHSLSATHHGTRVTHRLEIDGPACDQIAPALGPAITEDFPDAMEALLARAVAAETSAR